MDDVKVATTPGDEFLAEARRQLGDSAGMIRHAVNQLDDEQVWWRPREGMNSIGNLLLHLAGNLRQRFRSVIDGEPDDRDRFREFTEQAPIPLSDLRRRFDEAVGHADTILAGLDSGQLLDRRRAPMVAGLVEKSLVGVIFQTLTHLNGHAQEILHLTRWQLGEKYVFRNPDGVPPKGAR